MYRILTVAREYASGGGAIAEKVAARLGWSVLGNQLISQIAKHAHVDPALCARFDETLDSWVHRLVKRAFGRGAFESVAGGPGIDIFDGEAMAVLSRKLIEEAADIGSCVIIGRGAQCLLQDRRDAFHVYIYAPMEARVRWVSERYGPARATPEIIRANDRDRAAYVKHHYGCEWSNPHLYQAMFSSMLGEDAVAAAIVRAMGMDEGKLAHDV